MVNSIFDFFQKNKRIVTTILAALIPVIACISYGILQGIWIGDFYLPASEWNDEVLYFKQIEGVINYGIPQGYFGYNESTAKELTFSAWSPITLILYVLWGRVFGWSYNAPVICNIVLIGIGLAFLVYKVKMNYMQLGVLAGGMLLCTPISRNMMSCMADSENIFLLMLFMGFYLSSTQTEGETKRDFVINIGGMLFCSVFQTLMRPYFLLLFLFPGYLLYKKRKWLVFPVTVLAGLTTLLYFVIVQKFTAEYFIPLIDTDWIKAIIASPLSGIKAASKVFLDGIANVGLHCKSGVLTGNMIGGLWCLFILLLVIAISIVIKERKNFLFAISMVVMLGAVVMFYDVSVGSRHLLPFIVMMMIVLCEKGSYKTSLVVLVATLILFPARMEYDRYNYQVPVYDDNRAVDIEEINQQLKGKMICEETDNYWDNTVIWLFSDETMVPWQNFYALPKGMGINLCLKDYVLYNMAELKAKYIAVNAGESVDLLLEQTNATKLIEQGKFVIWQLRE